MGTSRKLCRTYSFKLINTEFIFTPRHKFNFIIDDSAKGKTWFCCKLMNIEQPSDILVLNSNNIAYVDITANIDKLILLDENTLRYLSTNTRWSSIQNSPNVFCIISRFIPATLSVDYRAIYTLECSNHKYSLKHKYKYLNVFKENKHYVTEDSGSGFQYFNNHYNNVESAHGKDNIPNKIDADTTIIADGSAFARILLSLSLDDQLLENLFLPDSFEGLVISCSNTNLAKSIYKGAFTDTVLKYKSIAAYFEEAIKLIYPKYNKENIGNNINSLELVNIIHYGITERIAQRYNVNRYDISACELLSQQIQGDNNV